MQVCWRYSMRRRSGCWICNGGTVVWQAFEAVVEVLLKGGKARSVRIGRRRDCASEDLGQVLMRIIRRPFGKARRVRVASLDEVNPVADESFGYACVVGSLHPTRPIVLAEKHEVFGVEGSEGRERSLTGISEVVEVSRLMNARGLGGQQASAEAEVEVAVHRVEDARDFGICRSRIGGEDLWRKRAELLVE